MHTYIFFAVGKFGIDGTDARLLHVVARKLNFKIQYKVAKGGWGEAVIMVSNVCSTKWLQKLKHKL